MAVMNSPDVWARAAGDRGLGLRWRDAVTARMIAAKRYEPYEELVAAAARESALEQNATAQLLDAWNEMQPWPDATALADLAVPHAFVTNCSTRLAAIAAERSGLRPAFVLSAEEAGCYKPNARIYHEACRRLGTRPERTLFVAGAPYDADGAAAAGLRAVLVARRSDLPEPSPDVRIVSSLKKIRALLSATNP